MPGSRSSIKRNRLRNQLGIGSHQRLSIRQHVPWYRRAAVLLVASLFGAGVVMIYLVVNQYLNPAENEVVQLRKKVLDLTEEVNRLNGQVGTGPNVAAMAKAAQQALAQQLEKCQTESAKLREELGFCEKNAKRETGVRKAPIHIPGAGTIPAGSVTN